MEVSWRELKPGILWLVTVQSEMIYTYSSINCIKSNSSKYSKLIHVLIIWLYFPILCAFGNICVYCICGGHIILHIIKWCSTKHFLHFVLRDIVLVTWNWAQWECLYSLCLFFIWWLPRFKKMMKEMLIMVIIKNTLCLCLLHFK